MLRFIIFMVYTVYNFVSYFSFPSFSISFLVIASSHANTYIRWTIKAFLFAVVVIVCQYPHECVLIGCVSICYMCNVHTLIFHLFNQVFVRVVLVFVCVSSIIAHLKNLFLCSFRQKYASFCASKQRIFKIQMRWATWRVRQASK